MVKSSSCFKLITCGGDSGEKDHDYQPVSENKDSNDKRGWSFRKKSARHRVLSNTVIAEAPSLANREISEYASVNVTEPDVAEKINRTNVSDEKPQLSSLESSQVPETVVSETESRVVDSPPEFSIIIIQAAIRGFLVRRLLLKSKNVVKLQAAVRGHLVRRHAVGTLRCVQAIVKMQALVRARRLQQSRSENLSHEGNEHHESKSNLTRTSVEKILSNKFARQLLESRPKNKPIHVKCDPSKGNSAWKWLERWMSVSAAADSAEDTKPIHVSEQPDKVTESSSVSQLETGIPSEVSLLSNDTKLILRDIPLPSEDEAKETTDNANNFDFQASPSTYSPVKDNLEEAPEKTTTTNGAEVASTENNSLWNQKMEPDASALQEPGFINQKPEIDGEQHKQSKKRVASDQLEIVGKKSLHGPRKSSNPAFIAAQSKFEELTSAAISVKSSSLSNEDTLVVESQADTSLVATDAAYRSKESFSSENYATYPSIIVGSESGTELSISSTLDSPDGSEAGAKENEHDTKNLVEGMDNPGSKIDHGLEVDILQAAPAASLPNSASDQSQIVDDISDNVVPSGVVRNSEEADLESVKNASGPLQEPEETVLQDDKMSPEASPRSQQYPQGTPSSQVSITISESQGTPSSQVSINKSKESKSNKTRSGNRRRILSVSNKSPANANHDSVSRGGKEQPAKDQSGAKRCSSFGTAKSDQIGQESGDNGSSNNSSLPRFMQVTESARAKINANSSPRSSPDVHDQDIHVKKRHSLPGATGRQGSPRVERSPQLSTKGNVLHERKWQR